MHGNKLRAEKLRLMGEVGLSHIPPGRLNEEGTSSVLWIAGQEDDYRLRLCGHQRTAVAGAGYHVPIVSAVAVMYGIIVRCLE